MQTIHQGSAVALQPPARRRQIDFYYYYLFFYYYNNLFFSYSSLIFFSSSCFTPPSGDFLSTPLPLILQEWIILTCTIPNFYHLKVYFYCCNVSFLRQPFATKKEFNSFSPLYNKSRQFGIHLCFYSSYKYKKTQGLQYP